MLAKFRARLTYSNVMATIAVFVAVSTGSAYAANTVFSTDIVDGEVKTPDIGASQVTGGKIKTGSVQTSDIAADAVDASKIPAGAVGSDEIATDAVGFDEIATDAVQAQQIANSSIDSGEIVDNSLLAADLAPTSVGSSEVANNSLTTADVAGADVNGGMINIGAGAVANGRCRDFAVGVGGAKAGEAVVFSIKAPIPEGILIYGQQVPSDGTVTMKVCNMSGTTMAAITNLPVRVITFG
jgi:hypothetical protein